MQNTIKAIEKEKIITIVRGIAKEKLIPLAQALYDGGIRLIECTYDAGEKISDEEIASGIEMLVGAGTVIRTKGGAYKKSRRKIYKSTPPQSQGGKLLIPNKNQGASIKTHLIFWINFNRFSF